MFETGDTRRCSRECIGEQNHFCPSNTYGPTGVCCDTYKCAKGDFCSFHTPIESKGLKLWSCPYDRPLCGSPAVKVVKSDNEKGPEGTKSSIMKFVRPSMEMSVDQLCRYKIIFHKKVAGEYDQLVIQAVSLNNMQLIVTGNARINDCNFEEKILAEGETMTI